ncbi:hypothetical protein EZV62_015308 [Acer yangbiense]|uniref:Uncharacterized protein n=1 Tax=Acer yangbiense TaxID=1000413 RepID=A0A5C7HKX9_9ROSI|nr:hypothetical protein EZV62_015308 [Acer yangbiense]
MDKESNIMYRDPELEASFSFSGYDLITNSSDDLCDDDDQYIEIELQQPRSNKHHEYYDDDGLDLDLELRISFSSSKSVPNFLQFSYNKNNGSLSRTTTVDSLCSDSIETVTTPSSSASSSTLSCSSPADTYWAAASPTTSTQPPSKRKRSSRVFEMMNMDAIRGILESMSITSLARRRDNKIKQSISSSPITAGGNPTDNSIQSAIAHCKTSFGQPSDFCF